MIKIMNDEKIPIKREDDGELLGFVVRDSVGWVAQTLFGYPIGRANDQQKASGLVRENGLGFLTGVWQYYDEDDRAWYPCVIKEAYEQQVTVIRTTPFGYQDPDDYKIVRIRNPDETNLIKS